MRRVTILKYAKTLIDKEYNRYCCTAIKTVLTVKLKIKYKADCSDRINYVKDIIPKFNYYDAVKDGFATNINGNVWFNNKEERIRYLNYLIDFYKNDKTDLKKEFKEYIKIHNETD